MEETVHYGANYAWVGLVVLAIVGAAVGWYFRSAVKAKAKKVAGEVESHVKEGYSKLKD